MSETSSAAALQVFSEDSGSDEQTSDQQARPFVKWAGGKTQLLKEIHRRAPKQFVRYIEPFVGGGALFFSLRASDALIGDINSDLMNVYTVVRDEVEQLIDRLNEHRYEKEYYYEIRDLDRTAEYGDMAPVDKAARIIYLNKTCYNGLYRVNQKGQFNTPFGRYKNPTICDSVNLRACSLALRGTQLLCGEFLEVLEAAQEGDFIYLDPPYAPVSKTANFTGYSADGFSMQDQERLATECRRLHQRGINFMLSNAATPEMEELYQDFQVDTVYASRAINSRGARRGAVGEILVTNY